MRSSRRSPRWTCFSSPFPAGPDSTALLLMAAAWARRRGGRPRLEAATVDHGLREGSAEEARAVGALCKRLGVPHRILHWRGAKPKSRIQERAREARYALLAECAQDDRRGFRRHRPSPRRPGGDDVVPLGSRLRDRRPERHGGAGGARRRDDRAAAARPRQARTDRRLRGRRRRLRARSFQRRSALRAHAPARAWAGARRRRPGRARPRPAGAPRRRSRGRVDATGRGGGGPAAVSSRRRLATRARCSPSRSRSCSGC